MGKYLASCWLAILFLLLLTELSHSKKKPKPSGGNWNSGGQRPPSYPQNPGYPRNPAYPPHNPGYPQQPGYPQRNPSYPQQPGYGGGYGGGYNSKPWKPKPPKTKLKHVAGAALGGAAVGALGGYLVGSAMSNMHFGFPNRNEEQWWYENRNRYSDQVYYPKYDQPVSRDVFVRDCTNVTVTEYIEPGRNKTADEMETKVVTQVVHQMCTEQYRQMSGVALLLANPSVLLIVTLVTCFLIH